MIQLAQKVCFHDRRDNVSKLVVCATYSGVAPSPEKQIVHDLALQRVPLGSAVSDSCRRDTVAARVACAIHAVSYHYMSVSSL